MRRNYIKVALRNLRRQPGDSFISVFGLAVGMMCCLFLLLYVHDELRYDRSYEKADRVYRVVTDVMDAGGTVNATAYSYPALGPAMLQGMPTVEAVTRVTVIGSSLIRVGEKPFSITGFTPIHHAAEAGSPEAARVLIEAGADVNVPSNAGETPLQRARRGGHQEVVRLLEAAGAK